MQKVCVVIPCFNEEKRFPVHYFLGCLNNNPEYFFCLVNDGSTDNTTILLESIKSYREERIMVLDLKVNVGKAEAVRMGVFKALEWNTFSYIAYFDADFSTPLSELQGFLSFGNKYYFIVGSRIKHMGSIIERSNMEHYFGRAFSTLASNILHLPVYDTQCGAKLINAKIVPIIFKEPFISRWLFDIEIFARIITDFGYDKACQIIKEVPLSTWIEKGGSKIKPSYIFKIPFELLKIRLKYKLYRFKKP